MNKKTILKLSKILIIIIAVVFVLNYVFSKVFENPVIASLPKCNDSECYYGDGFQDYTDYCKYYYNSKNKIMENMENSQYFKAVSADDVEELKSYFDNFQQSD